MIGGGLGIMTIGALVYTYNVWRLNYVYKQPQLPETFDEFYKQKLAISKEEGVRPGNEEKLIRFSEGQTDLAILYIHGYSASRAEGEAVVDSLAKHYQANTYYLRLPGSGVDGEYHASVGYKEVLEETETALLMTQKLGKKVIVVGTSMGGLLAVHLAHRYPDIVKGMILYSPFFDYANPQGGLLKYPGMMTVANWLYGPDRKIEYNENFLERKQEGYENYWITEQKFIALRTLEDLRAFVSRKKNFKKVACPVLLMYYYKDDKTQDSAASVKAMKAAFKLFGTKAEGEVYKKVVAIEDGNHVLTSRYVRTDKETVEAESIEFLDRLATAYAPEEVDSTVVEKY